MPINDTLNAFVEHGHIEQPPTQQGPLSGTTFALKDLFDLAGVPTGAGNPQWLATHPVPTKSSPIVDRLLGAGATLVGKTHTDEIAWSLNGENVHYGTPTNPAAPGRIPGGSSSGSAAATAGTLVDFAIGSDTGGSVRLPASYCGIYGIRTTHGRVSLDNSVPLARSYDVAGWFARSPQLMQQVGQVLLDGVRAPRKPSRLLIARDLFAAVDENVRNLLQPSVDRLKAIVGGSEDVDVAGDARDAWRNAFRVLQSEEAWAAHGAWISSAKPTFGPGVKERFAAAAVLDPAEIAAAKVLRKEIVAKVSALLAGDAILVLPTAPGIAPLLQTPEAVINVFRARAIELLCVSGHAGTPQMSLPVAQLDGCPIGLSIMAARDCDEDLLALAVELDR
ncbi:amidase [Tardiphaga sp.]|jgi:amidase|uniref:amidase n=1 Tax=Tardiphaga sp. TaxID=1926292 RepID=UPI0037DA38BD